MDPQETFPNEAEALDALQEIVPDPAWTFRTQAEETITVFYSLRTHLRYLADQDDPPLDSIEKVIDLMRMLRPAARQAAQVYAASQPVAPN